MSFSVCGEIQVSLVLQPVLSFSDFCCMLSSIFAAFVFGFCCICFRSLLPVSPDFAKLHFLD